ncbi:PH domain-containing protein [Paraferrimonas haliotis]|uniref:PH domain-containing protein n=1 Tax=Paraferrimonas haliotis TaxID=2013866 RepID=UPI000BA912D0|nr:PH domain-containing protein [Paraferrimonas haliotis]
MIFYSKMDWWLSLIMVATICICSYSVYTAFFRESAPPSWFTIGLIVIVGIFLPISILSSTKYQVDGNMLSINSGPFSWKVEISSIKSIRKTRSIISSPALSLDRIELQHSNGIILVSPSNKDEFVKALNAVREKKLTLEN